jgi:Ca2+-binding EF-hand superfamily protein
MAQQRWSEADTDRNGTLSQAEMQASMPTAAAKFSKMDANGDGQLSKDEMNSYKSSSDQARWNESFKTADSDGDGSLSLAEAQSGMPMLASKFSTIDSDRDGRVTKQELAAHHSSKRGGTDPSMDADTGTTRRSTTTSTTTTTGADTDKPDGTSPQ